MRCCTKFATVQPMTAVRALAPLVRQVEPSCEEWAVTSARNVVTATANRNDAIRAWERQGASLADIARKCDLPRSTVAYIVQQGRLKGDLPSLLPENDRTHPEYGFERFWKRYPKRDGKRRLKADALAVWRRMPYEDKAAAYVGTGFYADAAENGERVMDACRWLGKREWEEWQTPAVLDVHVESQRLQGTDRAKPAAAAFLAKNGGAK